MTDESPKPKKTRKSRGKKTEGKLSVRSSKGSKSAQRPTPSRARASNNPENQPPKTPEDAGPQTAGLGEDFAGNMERMAQKEAIIEACAEHSLSFLGAAQMVGIDRKTLWRWRRDDETFAKALMQAYMDGTELLKDEAVKRGKKSSDYLLWQTIGARDHSFRDPKYAAPHNQGPMSLGTVTVDLSDATSEELDVLRKLARRREARSAKDRERAPA